MSFEQAGRLLLPLDTRMGAIVHVDGAWRPLPPRDTATRVIWGREPTWEPAGARLAQFASRRELALALLKRRHGRHTTVHRWSHRFYRAKALPGLMWRLREGVIVELGGDPAAPRVVDAAAREAGVAGRVGSLHIAEGGGIAAPSVRVGAQSGLLRVGTTGSAGDPWRAAAGLETLMPLRHPCIPEVLDRGGDGDTAWTLESMLPGRHPARLTKTILEAIVDFCLQLPRSAAPPAAFGEHMGTLAERLPGHGGALRALESRHAPVIATLPSVLGHGDLWVSNLLFAGGRLSGVIDWDAWHPSAVPGTDLLHLVAAWNAAGRQRTFAELLPLRPWRAPWLSGPAMHRYWQGLEIDPREDVLEAVAVSWWAAQTVIRLARVPGDAADPEWRRRNVEPTLAAADAWRE